MNKEEAEKWAEEVLKDRDRFLKEEYDDFIDFLVYGRTFTPNTMIKLEDGTVRFEYLSKEQIIERYGYLLTEEEKKKLLE